MEKLLPSTPPEAHGFRKLEGAVNDAAWWARVVQARANRDDLRPQRVWTGASLRGRYFLERCETVDASASACVTAS
jgi:hypothetical protein